MMKNANGDQNDYRQGGLGEGVAINVFTYIVAGRVD